MARGTRKNDAFVALEAKFLSSYIRLPNDVDRTTKPQIEKIRDVFFEFSNQCIYLHIHSKGPNRHTDKPALPSCNFKKVIVELANANYSGRQLFSSLQ